MGDDIVVLILAALLGVQPITTDPYLPALPTLIDGFGAPMAQGQLTLSVLLIASGLFMLAHGMHQPCGQSGAVGPFPQSAGAASALNGFLMMLAAFAMGGWLGWRTDGTVLPPTNGIWFWSVLIAASGWILVQRHGEPAHAATTATAPS
jgi:hypothetical protein